MITAEEKRVLELAKDIKRREDRIAEEASFRQTLGHMSAMTDRRRYLRIELGSISDAGHMYEDTVKIPKHLIRSTLEKLMGLVEQ